MTYALARRAFGREAAALSVVLMLSVPTLLTLMGSAYVDVTLLFYTTAACYALLRWRDSRLEPRVGRRWLVLTGVLGGLSCGVKYTGVVVPVAVALGLAWASRRDGFRTLVANVGLVAGITTAVTLPWLIKNWLTAGNPVYPFLASSGLYWDSWRRWWYDRPGTGLAATAPMRLLWAPFEATILGVEGSTQYDATVGPLLLVSVGLLPVMWRTLEREERRVAGLLLLFVGAGYAFWLVGLARSALLVQTRLLLPVFGVCAVLGAAAIDRLRRSVQANLDIAWLVRAVVSITLVLLLFSTLVGFRRQDPLSVVLGLEATEDYLARQLGWYYVAIEDLDRQLSPGQAVLLLWEPRSYHCGVQCWPDALLDRWLHATYLYGYDAHAIASAWRNQGFTHVLLGRVGYEAIVGAGFDPVRAQDQRTLEELLSTEVELIAEYGQAYELYAFVAEDLP
jgi:4-amino-4-deoxy-L-arabinose transferase-like glycosyltransferase